MKEFRLKYVIFASLGTTQESLNASNESTALDAIDAFSARGFKLVAVLDQVGNKVNPMSLLDKLLIDERQAKASEPFRRPAGVEGFTDD